METYAYTLLTSFKLLPQTKSCELERKSEVIGTPSVLHYSYKTSLQIKLQLRINKN